MISVLRACGYRQQERRRQKNERFHRSFGIGYKET
jgi:hypothetical protein